MASKSRRGQVAEGKQQEDLKCAICLDMLKYPKLLPCLHAYCRRCLEGILRKARDKKQLTCPQCRSVHTVPTEGINGFPSDLVLESALELQAIRDSRKEAKKVVSCSMCAEEDPAVTHCVTCGQFLCDFCSKAHKRQLSYRNHKIVPMTELDAGGIKFTGRSRYCSHHPEEALKLYCKSCQELVCRDCTIVSHQGHSFGFAKDVRPEIQEQLQRSAKVVTSKRNEFVAHLQSIRNVEKDQEAHSVSLQADINRAFDTFMKTLESQRKQLLEQGETAKASNQKAIWAQKESLEVTLANLTGGLSYTERLCQCPSDIDMLAMSIEARCRLADLEKVSWDPKSHLKDVNPLVFSIAKTEHEVGSLDILDDGSCQISIRMDGEKRPAGMVQYRLVAHEKLEYEPTGKHPIRNYVHDMTCELGRKTTFAVEITSSKLDKKLGSLIIPSISIQDSNCITLYSNFITLYQGNGVWKVEFIPLHIGQFFISASLDMKGSSYPQYRTHRTARPYKTNPQPSSLYFIVTGTLNVGDRVERGPNWRYREQDGGPGNRGTVVSETEYYQQQQQRRESETKYHQQLQKQKAHRRSICVHWDNGNYGVHEWDENYASLQLVLDSDGK